MAIGPLGARQPVSKHCRIGRRLLDSWRYYRGSQRIFDAVVQLGQIGASGLKGDSVPVFVFATAGPPKDSGRPLGQLERTFEPVCPGPVISWRLPAKANAADSVRTQEAMATVVNPFMRDSP